MFIGSLNLSQIFDSTIMTDVLLEEKLLFQELEESSIQSHYPYELEKRLYEAMVDGDLKKIEELGSEYNTYTSSVLCENNSIRSLKNKLICSCALITRMVIDSGVDEKYAYFLSDLYINKIESINKEEPLLNLNAHMILDFMTQIKNSLAYNKNHYSSLTKKVIQYINDNLYTHLTLTDAANYVNANSSYLSRVFKKEVGITFIQYIHNSRIKRAQHLLLFSNLSLVEISTKLGYATQSHFNKMFKEITDMTPKQFNKTHILTMLRKKHIRIIINTKVSIYPFFLDIRIIFIPIYLWIGKIIYSNTITTKTPHTILILSLQYQ